MQEVQVGPPELINHFIHHVVVRGNANNYLHMVTMHPLLLSQQISEAMFTPCIHLPCFH